MIERQIHSREENKQSTKEIRQKREIKTKVYFHMKVHVYSARCL